MLGRPIEDYCACVRRVLYGVPCHLSDGRYRDYGSPQPLEQAPCEVRMSCSLNSLKGWLYGGKKGTTIAVI